MDLQELKNKFEIKGLGDAKGKPKPPMKPKAAGNPNESKPESPRKPPLPVSAKPKSVTKNLTDSPTASATFRLPPATSLKPLRPVSKGRDSGSDNLSEDSGAVEFPFKKRLKPVPRDSSDTDTNGSELTKAFTALKPNKDNVQNASPKFKQTSSDISPKVKQKPSVFHPSGNTGSNQNGTCLPSQVKSSAPRTPLKPLTNKPVASSWLHAAATKTTTKPTVTGVNTTKSVPTPKQSQQSPGAEPEIDEEFYDDIEALVTNSQIDQQKPNPQAGLTLGNKPANENLPKSWLHGNVVTPPKTISSGNVQTEESHENKAESNAQAEFEDEEFYDDIAPTDPEERIKDSPIPPENTGKSHPKSWLFSGAAQRQSNTYETKITTSVVVEDDEYYDDVENLLPNRDRQTHSYETKSKQLPDPPSLTSSAAKHSPLPKKSLPPVPTSNEDTNGSNSPGAKRSPLPKKALPPVPTKDGDTTSARVKTSPLPKKSAIPTDDTSASATHQKSLPPLPLFNKTNAEVISTEGCTYIQKPFPSVGDDAPKKPTRLAGIDLTAFESNDNIEEEDDDEFEEEYEDVESVPRVNNNSRTPTRPISEIPEMTEEEEKQLHVRETIQREDSQEVYDDVEAPPSASNADNSDEGEFEDIYECVDDL